MSKPAKPTFKRIMFRDAFTRRELARLAFMRWLVRRGIVNEGNRR